MPAQPVCRLDALGRGRGPGFRRAALLALLVWAGTSAGAQAQLQPCCQTIAETATCVLPWAGGRAACESGGGTFLHANRCRAGAFCDVVHEVPVAVEAVSGEIVLSDGLEQGTLVFDGGRVRGTMTVLSDPTCFTPPRAGTDCTIETELVALDLVGSTDLGEIVLHEGPTTFSLGHVGPVVASPEGCYGPAPSSFDLRFVLDLPALDLELRSVPAFPGRLEGTLQIDGADCSRLRGELALADRVLLEPDVTSPPAATAAEAPGDRAAVAAPRRFHSGQLSTLVLAFPAEPGSVLEVPGASWGGLALLALLLGAAALAVLARR